MKLVFVVLVAVWMGLTGAVMAKDTVTITKAEMKFLLIKLFPQATDDEAPLDCTSSSDCPKDWHCAGAGVCVPPAAVKMQSNLPNLFKPLD